MKIKDWKEGSDYQYLINEKRCHVWAWELLRRNENYQKDWLKHESLEKKYKEKYGNNWQDVEEIQIHEPPRLQKETRSEWVRRILDNSIEEPVSYSLGEYYALKWCLKNSTPINPHDDILDKKVFTNKFLHFPDEIKYPFDTKKYVLNKEEGLSDFEFLDTDELLPDKLILAFDINQPMNKQILKAKEIFKTRKKHQKTKHNLKQYYLEYVRLYDAVHALQGKKYIWKQIADFLYPNEENEYPDYKKSDALSKLYKKSSSLVDNPYSVL